MLHTLLPDWVMMRSWTGFMSWNSIVLAYRSPPCRCISPRRLRLRRNAPHHEKQKTPPARKTSMKKTLICSLQQQPLMSDSQLAIGLASGLLPRVMDWVYELEFDRLGLPKPSLQVYLSTPVEVAAQRASSREAEDATREKDQYEKDSDLQSATAAAYERLAACNWAGQWIATADQ